MFIENFEKVAGEVFHKSKHDGPVEAARKNYNVKVLESKTIKKPSSYNKRSLSELWQAFLKHKGMAHAI